MVETILLWSVTILLWSVTWSPYYHGKQKHTMKRRTERKEKDTHQNKPGAGASGLGLQGDTPKKGRPVVPGNYFKLLASHGDNGRCSFKKFKI